jgi:hypothetical protein
MLETKRISDAIESVRGRLEESSSCPAKSDRRISKPRSGSSLCDQGKKEIFFTSSEVTSILDFYCDRGRYHNRVKITIRVSPDKRKNPIRS